MKQKSGSLNILLICKSLPQTFKGGIQSHVWDLSEGLMARGHQVSILAGGSMRRSTYKEEVEGRRIIYLRYFRGKHAPFLKVSLEEFGFSLSVHQWLKKHGNQFDIIHGQGRSGAWIPSKVLRKVPTLNTYHGLISIENARPKRNFFKRIDDNLHKFLAEKLESLPLKNAKGVIYVSQATQDLVKDLYGTAKGNEKVIYNGFKGEFTKVDKEKQSNKLVFVGRLHPIKGLDFLVEAMSYVDPSIELILVGDGPMRGELVQKVQRLNLESMIEFKGALPKEEALKIMEQGFALILPSHFETQGIVLLEAHAKGLPVLASYAGGMKEVVKDRYNGLFFEPGNVKEMAEKIDRLYGSKLCRWKMAENGQKRVEEYFHWDAITQETEDFYVKIQHA